MSPSPSYINLITFEHLQYSQCCQAAECTIADRRDLIAAQVPMSISQNQSPRQTHVQHLQSYLVHIIQYHNDALYAVYCNTTSLNTTIQQMRFHLNICSMTSHHHSHSSSHRMTHHVIYILGLRHNMWSARYSLQQYHQLPVHH